MHAGIDSHKDTLAVAIVDGSGRKLATVTVVNEPNGYDELAKLFAEHGVTRVGMECSGSYGRPGAAALTESGFVVFEVPATMTVRERNRKPARGKSDPIDALAIARVVARGDRLPPARCQPGPADDLQQLTAYRRQLIKERTRISNRVHVDLTILRPGYQRALPKLTRAQHLSDARRMLRGLAWVRVSIARARLGRLHQLDKEIAGLAAQITEIVTATGTSLLEIRGVGPVTAGKILGETGDVTRFRDRNAYASGNGTAPIPVSSGRTDRHRLSRAGNRKLNEAIHSIALVQMRSDGPARAFIDRKITEGKSRREAMRSLKRRLSDVVYQRLILDQQTGSEAALGAALTT
jgi:transposase